MALTYPYDGSYNPGDPQSLNHYVYARNNPLGFLDPSGLCGYIYFYVDGQFNSAEYESCFFSGRIGGYYNGVDPIGGYSRPDFVGHPFPLAKSQLAGDLIFLIATIGVAFLAQPVNSFPPAWLLASGIYGMLLKIQSTQVRVFQLRSVYFQVEI